MNFLRALARTLYSKACHQHAAIAWGAYAGRDTIIGQNVRVSTESQLIECLLGDDILIRESSSLLKCEIESYSTIYENCRLEHVRLGSFSFIAESSRLSSVTIGRFCSIGPQAIVGYGDHPTNWISTSPVFYSTQEQCGYTFSDSDYFNEKKPIAVGHDVWMGARVFIRNGVLIGNGAIIGAGAVVVTDIPDFAIAVGCPAKVIRYRFDIETRQKISDSKWWNWDLSKLQKHQALFRQPDPDVFFRNSERSE